MKITREYLNRLIKEELEKMKQEVSNSDFAEKLRIFAQDYVSGALRKNYEQELESIKEVAINVNSQEFKNMFEKYLNLFETVPYSHEEVNKAYSMLEEMADLLEMSKSEPEYTDPDIEKLSR